MAIKNQQITVTYIAWDTYLNQPKTGDVGNHTLRVIKDGTAAAPTNSASEVDSTNAPGVYKLTLTAAEMNYDVVTLAGKSSTAGVVVMPLTLITEMGNLATIAAYIDTEVAAIKAKTDNLPASPAAVGDIPTANANADALLDRASGIETSVTLRQALRLVLAASAGKLSGAAGTTITIRNVGDSKDRITATVDANGNRTAVTTDVS